MDRLKFTGVAFQVAEGVWVAGALEDYIVTQGDTPLDALQALCEMIALNMDLQRKNQQPATPTPAEYHEFVRRARPLGILYGSDLTAVDDGTHIPGVDLDAYVLWDEIIGR